MICYCVFKERPDLSESAEFVEVQDQSGRRIDTGSTVQWTPHPTLSGLWQLGPFYIMDNAVSELSGAVLI